MSRIVRSQDMLNRAERSTRDEKGRPSGRVSKCCILNNKHGGINRTCRSLLHKVIVKIEGHFRLSGSPNELFKKIWDCLTIEIGA